MTGGLTAEVVEAVVAAAVEPSLKAVAFGKTGGWIEAVGASSWNEELSK